MEHHKNRWFTIIEYVEQEFSDQRMYSEPLRHEIEKKLHQIKSEMLSLATLSPVEKQELYFRIESLEREFSNKNHTPKQSYQIMGNHGNTLRTADESFEEITQNG